ncbi:uncharacterized protein [Clytia hemisphaerica]
MKLLLLATLCFVTIHVTMARHFHRAKNPVDMDENMIHKRHVVEDMARRDYLNARYDYFQSKRGGPCDDRDDNCGNFLAHGKRICTDNSMPGYAYIKHNCKKSCGLC